MRNPRIFISFAIEDQFSRNNLSLQAKQSKAPFDFVDMSVKDPWDSNWKTNCRTRIKGCDGVIVMLSNSTIFADGAKWEIKCAIEENKPLLPLYIHDQGCRIPMELSGRRIYQWTWDNVSKFIDSL